MEFKPYDEFKGMEIEHAVVVRRPVRELYLLWRQLEIVPMFVSNIAQVRVLDDKRSHWVAKGPLGLRIEWDSILTGEVPDSKLEWQSVPGSILPNAGLISFTKAGDGTELRVRMKYDPPGGRFGALFARVFGKDPARQLVRGLGEFKQKMEAGELEIKKAA